MPFHDFLRLGLGLSPGRIRMWGANDDLVALANHPAGAGFIQKIALDLDREWMGALLRHARFLSFAPDRVRSPRRNQRYRSISEKARNLTTPKAAATRTAVAAARLSGPPRPSLGRLQGRSSGALALSSTLGLAPSANATPADSSTLRSTETSSAGERGRPRSKRPIAVSPIPHSSPGPTATSRAAYARP
jgi:hypothetical protein